MVNTDIIIHINIYIFPMILLASIFISVRRNSIKATGTRLFGELLLTTLLLLFTDLVSWIINGKDFFGAHIIVWFVNFAYFILTPLIAIMWLNYINYYIHGSPLFKTGISKGQLLLIPITAYYLAIISTPFTKAVFSIDKNNLYVRGNLFYISYSINFIYLIITIIFLCFAIYKQKSQLKRKRYILLLIFTLFPTIASIAQMLSDNTWIAYPCTAILELMLYIHIQNKSITTDALTGLNNRGSLNTFLKEKADNPSKLQDDCLILVDIDSFKSINDTYGHDTGDTALIQTAELLSNYFYKTDSFLARYGGDEFCIITKCTDEMAAEELITELNYTFSSVSKEWEYPFTLKLSAGYTFINDDNTTPEKLISEADCMMYENKQRRRKI